MIDGLHPYPAYKPSGGEWLGDVPARWEVRRTKALLKERSEKGRPSEALLARDANQRRCSQRAV